MARILLGVSGGIAAYKSLELARLATVAGHGVRVLMTESAGRELGDGVGRGRRDQIGVAVGGQLEVADRVVLGPRLAGEGAAQRVAIELGDEHRGADDPLE